MKLDEGPMYLLASASLCEHIHGQEDQSANRVRPGQYRGAGGDTICQPNQPQGQLHLQVSSGQWRYQQHAGYICCK